MERPTLSVFSIERLRMTTDGTGVTTLVGAYGCPLQCRYCLNPHAWNPDTLPHCRKLNAEELTRECSIDHLYFVSTGGGITFGGGDALVHADFIADFRKTCPPEWKITVETALNVPREALLTVLPAVDDFIIDIKDMNPSVYRAYTGSDNARVKDNLVFLSEYRKSHEDYRNTHGIRIRIPLIPGFNEENDRKSSAEELTAMGFENLDFFDYVIRQSE